MGEVMENLNRENIAAKIEALLSKTIENGATEAEAMLAMKKATDLMAKYEFNLTSVQLEAGGIDQIKIERVNSASYFAGLCLSSGISAIAEVRSWRNTNYAGKTSIVYFGLKPDLIFAKWLHESLSEWCVKEANRWWKSPENFRNCNQITAAKRADLKKSFVIGCGRRITQRMIEAAALRDAERQKDRSAYSSGTSLVPVETLKKDIVKDAMNKAGIRLGAGKGVEARNKNARSAGYVKGAEATWSKAVPQGSTLRLK